MAGETCSLQAHVSELCSLSTRGCHQCCCRRSFSWDLLLISSLLIIMSLSFDLVDSNLQFPPIPATTVASLATGRGCSILAVRRPREEVQDSLKPILRKMSRNVVTFCPYQSISNRNELIWPLLVSEHVRGHCSGVSTLNHHMHVIDEDGEREKKGRKWSTVGRF